MNNDAVTFIPNIITLTQWLRKISSTYLSGNRLTRKVFPLPTPRTDERKKINTTRTLTFSFLRNSWRTSAISFFQPSCIVWNDSWGVCANPERAIISKSFSISLNEGRRWGSNSQQANYVMRKRRRKGDLLHGKTISLSAASRLTGTTS